MEANAYRNNGDFARAEGIGNALWAIAHAPTVGGWISVKAKLPGKLQNVLVSLVNEIDGHRLKDTQIGYHTDDAGHSWFITSWNEWAIASDVTVTHWMPLPEPPKEAKPKLPTMEQRKAMKWK